MSTDRIAPEEEMALAETLPQADASSLVDAGELEAKVKEMYGQVAREEEAELHFEVGRDLASRLGYPAELLDAIPAEALASFAGVGYHLDLAALQPGESRARPRLGLRDRRLLRRRAGRRRRRRRRRRLHATSSSTRRRGCATATVRRRSEFVEARIDRCRSGTRASTPSSPTA